MALTIRGGGVAEIAAYGIADAEARIEKELKSLLPGAVVRIAEVKRVDGGERIVNDFVVRYSVQVTLPLEPDEGLLADAWRRAFSAARQALAGSRFSMIEWERPDVGNGPG